MPTLALQHLTLFPLPMLVAAPLLEWCSRAGRQTTGAHAGVGRVVAPACPRYAGHPFLSCPYQDTCQNRWEMAGGTAEEATMVAEVLGPIDPLSLAVGFVVGVVVMLLIWLVAVWRRRAQEPWGFGGALLLLIVMTLFWFLTKEPVLLSLLTVLAGGLLALTGAHAARAMMMAPAPQASPAAAPAAAVAPAAASATPATRAAASALSRAAAPAAAAATAARPAARA